MSNTYGSTWRNKNGATHYELNKQYYKDKARKHQDLIRRFIFRIKRRYPCFDCKINYPFYVKDFDHLEQKSIEIARLPNTGWKLSRIKDELRKCQLVCANCHRERTYSRL